jgi:hypothetical protein
MSEHTPGPWRVLNHASGHVGFIAVVAGERTHICDVFPYGTRASTAGLDEHLANARLIAAAPDLLAALKEAVRIAELARLEWDGAPNGMRAGKLLIALAGGCPGYRPDIDAIHAAIAKATAATPDRSAPTPSPEAPR